MNKIITTNIADFGDRELDLAKKLLEAVGNSGDFPEDFDTDGVQFLFNRNTGDVFLTNDSGQLCTASEGKLFTYHYLPYSGEEGTLDDFVAKYTELESDEDREYIRDIITTYYNDEYTLPKRTKDGVWVEYGDECYTIDELRCEVVEFDWDTIDESDNEETTIDAYASYVEAEKALIIKREITKWTNN